MLSPKSTTGCGITRSVINGLADSIWAGSKHQEEAWKWVKFLASPEAQKIVAGYGIVFPAIPEATEIAKARMAAKGVDVSAFVEEAKDPQGTFFAVPVNRAIKTLPNPITCKNLLLPISSQLTQLPLEN